MTHSNDICPKKCLNRLKLALWKSRAAILIAAPLSSCKILSSTISQPLQPRLPQLSHVQQGFPCLLVLGPFIFIITLYLATLKPNCQPTKKSIITLEIIINFFKRPFKKPNNTPCHTENMNAICWRLKAQPPEFTKVASSFLLRYFNSLP